MPRRQRRKRETLTMLEVYRGFCEEYLAIPLIWGRKSAAERFAGADETYTIEGLMGDGRALQCGTSHFLGQNFSRAFNIRYLAENNELQFAWQTSWGVSTRLLGAIIMVHGDDQGLRLPPKVAPIQAVIVPIWRKPRRREGAGRRAIIPRVAENAGIRGQLDDREASPPGFKFNDSGDARGAVANRNRPATWLRASRARRRDTPGQAGKSKRRWNKSLAYAAVLPGEFEKVAGASAGQMDANTTSVTSYHQMAHQDGKGECGGVRRYLLVRQSGVRDQIREDTRATCQRFHRLVASAGPVRLCGEPPTERAFSRKRTKSFIFTGSANPAPLIRRWKIVIRNSGPEIVRPAKVAANCHKTPLIRSPVSRSFLHI